MSGILIAGLLVVAALVVWVALQSSCFAMFEWTRPAGPDVRSVGGPPSTGSE